MILLDIAIIFFLEVIEANLTKDKGFEGIIEWYHYLLKNNIGMFLLVHSSMFYLFYTAYSHNLTGFIISMALVMKLFDLITKIYLSSKVDENGRFKMLDQFGVPAMEVSTPLRYSGALIYPLAIMFSVA
ncbi:MAG: hypothetical protein OIF32_12380 [Campylobacterales bacterium]|nr:hypothetical protein [Campylobacterales bacterium]